MSTHRVPPPERTYVPPGHFYSPIPSTADITAHRRERRRPLPSELPGIDLREDAQLALLAELRKYYVDQPWAAEPKAGLRYYFENPMYSYGDAVVLHCMLRHVRPRRIIEVGAGFTTAAMLDTIERFLGDTVDLTCVDPDPARLESLTRPGDDDRVHLIRQPAQEIPLEVFSKLASGDLLFVDSTHVAKLRSDVNRLVLEVLPALAQGVIVHFHDVFWPFEYPLAWVEENRAWNELYLLRAFLAFNDTFEIVLFSHLMWQWHRDELTRGFPLAAKNIGGNLWLRRK